jgi:hypothetical protein
MIEHKITNARMARNSISEKATVFSGRAQIYFLLEFGSDLDLDVFQEQEYETYGTVVNKICYIRPVEIHGWLLVLYLIIHERLMVLWSIRFVELGQSRFTNREAILRYCV